MKTDIVIVGGGLSGLVAGARLADRGHRVILLERASATGGRARSIALGEVPMNLGPHALYRNGRAEAALREIGVVPTGFVPDADGAVATLDGRAFALPGGPLSLLASRLLDVGQKLDVARFLLAGERAAREAEGRSIGSVIDEAVRGDRARALLRALVRVATYSNAPDLVDAGAALRQLAAVRRHGVLYVDGGWQRLVDAAEAAARARGVEIRQAEVTRADPSGRVTCADGHELVAEHVLLAVPAPALDAIAPALPRRTRVSSRAACLDLVVRRLPLPSRRFALGIDAPYYVSVHSPRGEAGPLRVQAARYLAPGERGQDARGPLEAWLELAHPGLTDEIVASRFLPEMVVQSALPTVGHTCAVLREGALLAVGDHAEGGFLLDAALASVDTACAALERDGARAA